MACISIIFYLFQEDWYSVPAQSVSWLPVLIIVIILQFLFVETLSFFNEELAVDVKDLPSEKETKYAW